MKRWRVFRAPDSEMGGVRKFWYAQQYGTTTAIIADGPKVLYYCIEALTAGRMRIEQLGCRERELLVPAARP